jgi:hypothetical protein
MYNSHFDVNVTVKLECDLTLKSRILQCDLTVTSASQYVVTVR